MYTIKYSDDNIYTGNISETSDIKYVKVFNFDYDFSTEKSIVSDYITSTACVCFYKNKGTNIFPTGRYKEQVITFSNDAFYQASDLNHNLDTVLGHKSSSTFLGSSEASFYFSNDCGIKINFNDVYGVSFSFWIYVDSSILYVKDNDGLLYNHILEGSSFSFGFYNGTLVVNSEDIITIAGKFLPYDLFLYGNFNDINIVSKYSIPIILEGTGGVKDDIYGDAYYITKPATGLGYLKSKANNVLTSCSGFVFDIAFRAVGNSIPFSISDGATFNGSNFVMNNANMWVEFDIVGNVFYSNIVTSSGIVTISGVALECNNYYLMRCYYEDNRFGVILNGVDTNTVCDGVTISGGYLNLLTYNTLIVDSFALYKDISPSSESYNQSLAKLTASVSNTALVNSHNINKVLFGIDNFFPEDYYYNGTWSGIENVPITSSPFNHYVGYSLAGGEAELSNDYFYARRLPFNEDVYNCFVCENDKTFLTYFSGIVVPTNRIIAESFTNYNYVNDNFITTNSGLYIRNHSKVFNSINSASVIEFSNIGWVNSLSLGALFEADSIPELPNLNCTAVTGSGILYVGETTFSGLDINSNSSIYFYLNGSSVLVSGSNIGILGSGIVANDYSYIKYFIKNDSESWASVDRVYVSTAQREINTLSNKCFDYSLPEFYNLNDSYKELFYNIGSNVLKNGIVLYDYDFYDLECSFSSYYDATFSGIFNIGGYNFLGINDNFENGFITERWRLVCSPYGVYSCYQPGKIPISSASCSSCTATKLYDGSLSTSVHSSMYIITVGSYYYLYFTNANTLVDTISIHVTSDYIQPEDGFVISCDVEYYEDGVGWHSLLNNYASPTLSGTSWPIRHDISVPVARCDDIRIRADSNWDQVVPTEIRPSCFYNYGGTAVCTTSGVTCVHVVLDEDLYVYSEYVLEDSFGLSFSGINYYPLNSKLCLKDYSENECYIKTDWITSSGCNVIVSSAFGDITSTVSGISGSVEYVFSASRFLDKIDLVGYINSGSGTSVYSNYSFSADDLGVGFIFYNKSLPNVVGSGCLFGFEAEDYTVNFSSIAAGYKYTALDGTNNITKAGVGFNTYPPNLFVDKTAGSYVEQSHKACQELTASGFQLVSSIVDNNVSIETGEEQVGGVQQISKFNKIGLFSDYQFMPTIFYRIYIVGEDQQYTSFSDVSSLIQTGDKVYFYPGSYTVTTDKQITVIGIGNPTDIQLSITNASSGLTVMGCTTTRCAGSNVFNMYNCYILPWNYSSTRVILYDVVNINFYNCCLYNYSNMSYLTSYALLHKCTVNRSTFRWYNGNITVYNEGYSTRGYYGYGPEFNRASIISGLSHVDSVVVSSFYYNSVYNHFPLHNQTAVEKDSCEQLISSSDSYSVYFYGDIKKLNSFYMYLFIQDLDGKIEISNSSDFIFTVDSNNLNAGMHLVINIYGLEINMSVPISHSKVFKLSIVTVVFDGGSISIYLNGAKLATKYIVVVDFNDASSYLNDSILFFNDAAFTCDGNGLLLKGAALKERVDFLVGTHVEELGAGCSTTIKVNMEFSTYPVLSEYHNNDNNYYGYVAYNTGCGVYFNESVYDYEHIYFNANKSYKIYQNIAKRYLGVYRRVEQTVCISESKANYLSPIEKDSITFSAAKIDNYNLGYCNLSDPYGYVALDLSLPVSVIDRSSYCFETTSSVMTASFDLSADPWFRDVGPGNFTCYYGDVYYGNVYSKTGIFHNSVEYRSGDYGYITHKNALNLNNNFTIEFLFSFYDDNGFNGCLLTKGTASYNIAYRVGITSQRVPYFKWSWEGDNVVYAKEQIYLNDVTYLVVVVGVDTISFYINGKSAGVIYTDKLTIVNNSAPLYFVYGYPNASGNKKQVTAEEVCLLNRVKTKKEIEDTWDTISGGDNAPWIKINNVVVSSDKPIKVSPSDRFIESDNKIDISKWEYRSYIKPQVEDGLVIDSRLTKKIKSKSISYNVIFDVSIFCEFLEYSTNRSWSISFKYKFSSGNYITVIINYVKYDGLYVKCEYYYNGYKNNTSALKLILSPCGIRFFTDYSGYTYVQIGSDIYWYTLWTSTQNLFVETSGWLEVTLSNDEWDSWFIVKLTNFLSRLYCNTISNGDTLNFYDAVPYGRAFYNQIPENVAVLTLSNDVFEIDSSLAGSQCIHSLEFINGGLSSSHVLDLNNNIFDNVNYETFNIELLVYLTYADTTIIDLFPWLNIEVKDKYLYVVMRDNDHIITDSISQLFNDYVYIAVSIGNPHTTLHINNQVFTYDTNFTKVLPYHFYPIGKSFSGRVVYFCGYYGDFDTTGYEFRVNSLSRYIGFDNCGRKIFGSNLVTSLDVCSIIYSYDNPTYSVCLKALSHTLQLNENVDVKILIDPAVLQSVVASVVVIRCVYSTLVGKKTTSITVSADEYNASHNYYDSFGNIGEGVQVFSYDLVGTCYDNSSVFYLNIDNSLLEKILTGVVVLNVKNNETNIITSINIYLNGELSINDIYSSPLLVV